VPTVESWANAFTYHNESNLEFEDDRYYEERLVPDQDEEVCKLDNVFIIHY
jgi:hypothetical protein